MDRVEDLKSQHDKLHMGVADIAALCDRFAKLDRDTMLAAIRDTLEFFRDDVGPHALAEESVLYPEVGRLLNVHLSDMLVNEHRRIDRLVAELAEAHGRLMAGSEVPSNVLRTLTALVNLMRSHLRQEEEVLLTMLDVHLSNAEARALFERMEEATDDAATVMFPPKVLLEGRAFTPWSVSDLPIAAEARSSGSVPAPAPGTG